MSMPKGTKVNRGYATTKDGLDYRRISEKLAEDGYKMNHATASSVRLAQESVQHVIVSSYTTQNRKIISLR